MSINKQNNPGYKHTGLGYIPIDWQVKGFGSVTKAITCGLAATPTYVDESLGRPFFSAQNVQKGKVIYDNYKHIPETLFAQITKNNKPQKGDILYTRVGAGIGEAAVIDQDLDFAIYVSLTLIKCNEEVLHNYFVFQLLNSPHYKYLAKRDQFAGGGVQNLNVQVVKEFPVPVPCLSEQRKIAAILSTWDEAITKTQQLIAQLQKRNKGLMQQLLTGKKRLKGFEGEEWKKLHATEIFKSVSVKNNGFERLLSATQDRGIIPRDMLEARVTMPAGETASFKLVEIGDFVISLRSFQGGIEYSEYRGLVSPAYTVLKPTKEINTSFFKHYFKSYDFIGHLAVAVIGIRDGKQVSYEDFSILKLPYPAVEEQEAIAKVLDAAVGEVRLYEKKLAALQQQKKGLMQKLLTGEVRVNINEDVNN